MTEGQKMHTLCHDWQNSNPKEKASFWWLILSTKVKKQWRVEQTEDDYSLGGGKASRTDQSGQRDPGQQTWNRQKCMKKKRLSVLTTLAQHKTWRQKRKGEFRGQCAATQPSCVTVPCSGLQHAGITSTGQVNRTFRRKWSKTHTFLLSLSL